MAPTKLKKPKASRPTRAQTGAGRIYTRGGDRGQTSLASGERVPKDNPRLDTYGLADELNSIVGAVMSELQRSLKKRALSELTGQLLIIQHDLFHLCSQLSVIRPEIAAQLPTIHPDHVARLEKWMDAQSASLPPLKNFILPGGSPAASLGHVARTVCRALERRLVNLARSENVEDVFIIYINRLSDYFFVLSRSINRIEGFQETIWSRQSQNPQEKSPK